MKRINKTVKPVEQPKEETVDQLIEDVKEVKLNKKIEAPKKKIIKNDSKIKMNITKPSKKAKKEEIKLDTDSDSSEY
jgi:hypothetical protein